MTWETIAIDPVHVKAGENCAPLIQAALERAGRKCPPLREDRYVAPSNGTVTSLLVSEDNAVAYGQVTPATSIPAQNTSWEEVGDRLLRAKARHELDHTDPPD